MTRDELTLRYRMLDNDIAMLAMKLKSIGPYETRLFLPLIESRETLLSECSTLLERVNSLEAPDRVYCLLRSRFREFLICTQVVIKEIFKRPTINLYSFLFAADNLVLRDSRSDEQRREILLARFSQLPQVWSAMEPWLETAPVMHLKELIGIFNGYILGTEDDIESMRIAMASLGESGTEEIAQAIRLTAEQMAFWNTKLVQLLEKRGAVPGETSEEDSIPFTESHYRTLLQDTLGINLDELLSWHEEEVSRTRESCLEIASHLGLAEKAPSTMSEVNLLLAKYSQACSSPEEMFARAQVYVDRARDAAHRYVSLPEDEHCVVVPISKRKERDYPWGAYEGGCPYRHPLRGDMVLNKSNYANISDGWLKMTSIHECYPGHHVQFIRQTLDTLPTTNKLYVMGTPLKEGTAHRSEQVFGFIYEEDPLYPLFVAYRKHHTATRIKADLWLRYFGRPIGEAVDLYITELGIDRISARAQVRSQESMQAFYTSYYYGAKKLEELEESSGLSSDDFTRRLFDVGDMSLSCFSQYLALNQEEQQRYRSEFKSIYYCGK